MEPGNDWYYTGWLGALAENPGLDGDDLGIAICNSYYEGCEAAGTEEQTTLSVTDLTKLTPLLEAYEVFGQEAFVAATEEPGFFAELGRAAAQTDCLSCGRRVSFRSHRFKLLLFLQRRCG